MSWTLLRPVCEIILCGDDRGVAEFGARHLADIERARTLIGFQPEVSFDEGLARTVAWFRERQERA